jgi:hypothetical protein
VVRLARSISGQAYCWAKISTMFSASIKTHSESHKKMMTWLILASTEVPPLTERVLRAIAEPDGERAKRLAFGQIFDFLDFHHRKRPENQNHFPNDSILAGADESAQQVGACAT